MPIASKRFTIGAGARCSLRIDNEGSEDSEGLSPLQCLISEHAGRFTISRWNGHARLNGDDFSIAPLSVGDRLEVAGREFEVSPYQFTDVLSAPPSATDTLHLGGDLAMAKAVRAELRRHLALRCRNLISSLRRNREQCRVLEESLAGAADSLAELRSRREPTDADPLHTESTAVVSDDHAEPDVSVEAQESAAKLEGSAEWEAPTDDITQTRVEELDAIIEAEEAEVEVAAEATEHELSWLFDAKISRASDVATLSDATPQPATYSPTSELDNDNDNDEPESSQVEPSAVAENSNAIDALKRDSDNWVEDAPIDEVDASDGESSGNPINDDKPVAEQAEQAKQAETSDKGWTWDIETAATNGKMNDLWGTPSADESPASVAAADDSSSDNAEVELSDDDVGDDVSSSEAPGHALATIEHESSPADSNDWRVAESAWPTGELKTADVEQVEDDADAGATQSDDAELDDAQSDHFVSVPVNQADVAETVVSPVVDVDVVQPEVDVAVDADALIAQNELRALDRVASLFAAKGKEESNEGDQPESFIARYAHVLEQDVDEPEQSAVATEMTKLAEPNVEPSAAEDDDEALDNYMQKMMQRLRGSSEAEVGPRAATPRRTPTDQSKPAEPISTTPATPQPVLVPFASLDELKKSAAAENAHDLSVFRELANSSARVAIGTSELRRLRDWAGINLSLSGIVLAAGGYMLATATMELSPATIGGGLLVVVGTWWGGLTTSQLLKALKGL